MISEYMENNNKIRKDNKINFNHHIKFILLFLNLNNDILFSIIILFNSIFHN